LKFSQKLEIISKKPKRNTQNNNKNYSIDQQKYLCAGLLKYIFKPGFLPTLRTRHASYQLALIVLSTSISVFAWTT